MLTRKPRSKPGRRMSTGSGSEAHHEEGVGTLRAARGARRPPLQVALQRFAGQAIPCDLAA